MSRRFLSLWFRHLLTDAYVLQKPALSNQPFVMAVSERGRRVICGVHTVAESAGIRTGMAVADARAVVPALQVVAVSPGKEGRLLHQLGEWCLRYTPDVALDLPDGLMLDISGCPHLWGGERAYLRDLVLKLRAMGYDARAAIADTIGTAWAVARYGRETPLIAPGLQPEALQPLPPAALRLEPAVTERLHKLGLYTIGHFIAMPRPALGRRFGPALLTRLDQALGTLEERMEPLRPAPPYEVRLPCPEPIRTAAGIEEALRRLLKAIGLRLYREGKGLRTAVLTCYRIDHKKQTVQIQTSSPCRDTEHLLKLFALRIPEIRPAWGIDLFLLEARATEALLVQQEALWQVSAADEKAVAELLDKIAGKVGAGKVRRYLPRAHYWPERSYRKAAGLQEKPDTSWREDPLRPVFLLPRPEKITVSVLLPDYPPLLFRYRGRIYRIIKAEGPERMEREWWLEEGLYRDYYAVEAENGARYWLFRSGPYNAPGSAWYLHGFFA